MKQHITHHLTDEEKKIKDALQGLGSRIQKDAEASENAFLSKIEELYDRTESGSFWMRVINAIRRPRSLILVPVGLVTLVLVVQFLKYPMYTPMPVPVSVGHRSGGLEASLGGSSTSFAPPSDTVSPDSIVSEESFLSEAGFSGSTSALGRRPTFKERFLNTLGRHEASPEEVVSRPQFFEQDVHADLMTTKEENEVRIFMKVAFESLGGFVETINAYPYRTRSVRISGKVPAQNLQAFKIMMQDFAKEPKYYQESAAIYNRTSDIVAIEDEREKVEKAIAYLEESLARETDPQKRASLERQLTTHRARLRERDATREAIEDRVEYADVSLTIQLLPTFWRASSFSDFEHLYVGFGTPSLLDSVKIAITQVFVVLVRALGYLIWIAPLVWLWWRKSHRAKGLLKELD